MGIIGKFHGNIKETDNEVKRMNELIVEKKDFSHEHLTHVKTVHLNNYPIVYILYNHNKKPSVYIDKRFKLLSG
ncbi:hypothetical protein [Rossellomorea oryzaecorticis]